MAESGAQAASQHPAGRQGPRRGRKGRPGRAAGRGPRADRGLSGGRQDRTRASACPLPGRRVRPRPMHGGPAARGRDRHQRLQPARGAIRVPSRARVRERRAGRRGQPHFAQDPVGPARVHAGAARDGRRPGARAGAAVPRHRDPEPHRVRGDLPASRGSARPVHGASRARIPGGRRGGRDARRPRGARPGDGPRAGCGRRDRARRAGGGDRRPWLRGVAAICRSALRRDPAGRAGRAGRKPSSGAAALPGRQGPSRRSRGAITRSRTTSRRWPPPSSKHRLLLAPGATKEDRRAVVADALEQVPAL